MVSRRVITIVIVLLVLAAVIYGIWWFFNNWDQVEAQALSMQVAATLMSGFPGM